MKTQDLPYQQTSAKWSNRILILSLLGIFYLTLFPFVSPFVPSYGFRGSPFLLGPSTKPAGDIDFFLNVLLFVPLGFGICAKMRKRGGNRWVSLLFALAAGALVSYLVELMQLYIPSRDSGWDDVLSNSAGSAAGFFLFELGGGAILWILSKCEDLLDGWLSPRRAVLLLACYLAICFCGSALLQAETHLSGWDPQGVLFVGNDASGKLPWVGKILALQIWNRALPEQAVRQIAAGKSVEDASAGLLASYDFSNPPPYQDTRNFSPPLVWIPKRPQATSAWQPELDGKSWLRTAVPAENVNREIEKSSQFTIHLVCEPGAIQVTNGRVAALEKSAENVNFYLWAQGSSLVFWFRNPLSETRSKLGWTAHDAFKPGKMLDIVASYDGADAHLYLDGKPSRESYRLSPGASFIHHFYYIFRGNLEGYFVVYETLVFMPAGLLIGLAARRWSEEKISGRWMFAIGWVLPAVLLEGLLAGVSGRRMLAGNIALSLVLGLAGVLLINADRDAKTTTDPL